MPISVRLSKEAEHQLDEVVKKGGYKDRSAAIRDAVDLLAQELDGESNQQVMIQIAKADLDRLRRARILR